MSATTLVVSPHLDDAVLSCGGHLATQPGCLVATVMAGHPGPGILSDWDRGSGFVDGDDPVTRRRQEDQAALAAIGAQPHHLDFLDGAYLAGSDDEAAGPRRAEDIAARLSSLLDELSPATVLIPMGLLHPDHQLTHDATILLLRTGRDVTYRMYKDLPYGLAHPDLVRAKLDQLVGRGLRARAVAPDRPPDMEAKRRAVACYASQLVPLRGDHGNAAWEGTFHADGEELWHLSVA